MTNDESQKPLLDFPCNFPIKAVGKNQDDFPQLVRELVITHLPLDAEPQFKIRPSRAGQYLSVTITIEAHSQSQLDAIYHDLTACEAVLMAL